MEITVYETSWDDPIGVELRHHQEQEIVRRYGDDLEHGPKPSACDIETFLLALESDSGSAVGCGALRALDGTTAEVKRMYVVPDRRGRRIGQRVLGLLEEAARRRGFARVRLETGTRQPESLRLYERCGYARIANFGPYRDCAESVCFERSLRTP